jgi:membrane-bound lytic murein transglycosylase A
MNRLMIAQDTGSAIKGAQRADIFYGTGDAAGRAAGRIKDGGRMVVLLPIQNAYAKLPQALID